MAMTVCGCILLRLAERWLASNQYLGSLNGWSNTSEDRLKGPNAWNSGKTSKSRYMSDLIEKKLRCAICMDTMREATTTCRH
ncbi:Zinc finger, C3HC4 type (RING finger), partial [Musa troglodytarum]